MVGPCFEARLDAVHLKVASIPPFLNQIPESGSREDAKVYDSLTAQISCWRCWWSSQEPILAGGLLNAFPLSCSGEKGWKLWSPGGLVVLCRVQRIPRQILNDCHVDAALCSSTCFVCQQYFACKKMTPTRVLNCCPWCFLVAIRPFVNLTDALVVRRAPSWEHVYGDLQRASWMAHKPPTYGLLHRLSLREPFGGWIPIGYNEFYSSTLAMFK